MNSGDADNCTSESEVTLPKTESNAAPSVSTPASCDQKDTSPDMSNVLRQADSATQLVSSSQPGVQANLAPATTSESTEESRIMSSQPSPDDGHNRNLSDVVVSTTTICDTSMPEADTSVEDVDATAVSSTSPSSQLPTSSAPDTTDQVEIPLKSNVLQSPMKNAPTKSPVVLAQGAVRSKFIVTDGDEGPTVRQHLQQQQLVQRQQKLQLQHQQYVLHKAASVGGESSAHALTNSLIQPSRIPSQLAGTVRMQLTAPLNPASYRPVRQIVQIPGASISAPPPRTDSPSMNAATVKQEGADDRPDSVASEGAIPRMSDECNIKPETTWSAMQVAPTILNGSDISTLVRPGPPLPHNGDSFLSQGSFIQTEQGIIQSVAHGNGVSLSGSPLAGSLIIQSVPRINPNPPSSLSAVLTTSSTLSGPICTVINGGDMSLQQKFVGPGGKLVQQRPGLSRLITAPTPKDDRHYARKISFMKRTIRSLVFKNGALCDEVARLNQRIQTVTEERRLLCKRLQHHERNRIRRLQTQLKKADKNKNKAEKETGSKTDEPDAYDDLIARASAEAERTMHDYSAEDSERTLSPSPTPSSMSPVPTEEHMLVDDSPSSYPYSEVNSKENGMDYESTESSPRQCSSPSSSVGGAGESQQANGSRHDGSRPSSVNGTVSPMDSPAPSARTLRRSARNSGMHDEEREASPPTSV